MEDVQAEKLLPSAYVSPTIHSKFPNEKLSVVDYSIDKIEPCVIYPESVDINSKAPIDFVIHDSAGHFLDLSSLQLEVTLLLRKEDDNARPGGGDNVYFTNNLLSALFPIRKVFINNQNVETQYAGNHIGAVNHLLKSDNKIARNRGESRGLFPIISTQIGTPVTVAICQANNTRQTFSKKELIHLRGYLDLDITNLNMWLVDLCSMRITLEPAGDNVIINRPAGGDNYVTKIDSIKMHINHIKPTNGGFISTSKLLNKKPLEYLFTRHVVYSELLPSGQNSLIINRPFTNRIPSKILIFMVKQSADQGDFTEDAHYYRTNGLENYRVMIDGKQLVNQDVDSGNNAVSAFVNSLDAQDNAETFIPFEVFTDGCFVLSIKTNHSQPNELAFERKGNLAIHLKFSNNMATNQVVYVVGICHSSFEITADRNCVTNYSY